MDLYTAKKDFKVMEKKTPQSSTECQNCTVAPDESYTFLGVNVYILMTLCNWDIYRVPHYGITRMFCCFNYISFECKLLNTRSRVESE